MAENVHARAQKAVAEGEELTRLALESTPEKYRRFIMVLSRNQNFGDRKNQHYVTIQNPYMRVDGQVLMARDEHQALSAKLDMLTEYQQVADQFVCRVTVVSEIHGTVQGDASIPLKATSGAESTNPIEVAQTSALGRALRFMGYGLFGSDPDNSYNPSDREPLESDNPIPNMSGTPAQESDPKSTPARQGQIGKINGMLKKFGVRDGHKTKLRELVYPSGITVDVADRTIEELESYGRLSGRWINPYIKMLLDPEPEKKQPAQTFMQSQFNTIRPAELSHEQQLQLIAFICDGEVPSEEPDDIYLPGEVEQIEAAKVDADDWVRMIADICSGTSIGSNLFAAWALKNYGTGQKDVTELSESVYNALRSQSIEEIRSSIMAYAAEAE